MRFTIILLPAVLSISVLLAGCGGAGSNTTPYDGTWSVDYSGLSQKSTITLTESVICNSPPATLIIKQSEGSATQTSTCVTSAITEVLGTPTSTVIGTQSTVAYISISISPHIAIGSSDVVNALVNGVPFTGECISNNACSASITGSTLSLTRI